MNDQGTTSPSLFDEILDRQADPAPRTPQAWQDATSSTEEDLAEGPPVAENATDTLAEGLPPEARKALVHLYRIGSVLYTENKARYEILCRYERQIREHMADVYLEVTFDLLSGHIFTQVASPDDDEEEPARLITAKPLTLYQSLLLVVLRKFFQDREATGERIVVIDFERLASLMTPFIEATNSEKKDTGRLSKAINHMMDKRLLLKVRGEEYRYQINPIIRNVVSAELLESLLEEYKRMIEQEEDQEHQRGRHDPD